MTKTRFGDTPGREEAEERNFAITCERAEDERSWCCVLARSVSSRDEEGDKIGKYECMSFDSSTTELVLDSFDVFKGRGENDLCQVLSLSANATRVNRELEHTA